MLVPANDIFPLATIYDLSTYRAQAKAKEAARNGRAFLATWVLKLTAEGVTSANKCALMRAVAAMSDEAREWVSDNRPQAWRP